MLKRWIVLVTGVVLIVFVAACGATPASSPAPASTPTRAAASALPAPTLPPTAAPTQAVTTPRPQVAKPPSGAEAAVANAQADLAQRLGIAPASATIVQSEAMTWNTAALGCPQPGVMYMQLVTPGYRVVLEAGGRQYDYRATADGQVRLCETPSAPTGAASSPTAPPRGESSMPTTSASQGTPAASSPWAKEIAAAQADLMKREPTLKAADIHVQSAQAVTWNDGSLGCPQPGMMYTMALVPGYRVVLEAGGKTFSYHGAQEQPPKLCENPRLPGGAATSAVE